MHALKYVLSTLGNAAAKSKQMRAGDDATSVGPFAEARTGRVRCRCNGRSVAAAALWVSCRVVVGGSGRCVWSPHGRPRTPSGSVTPVKRVRLATRGLGGLPVGVSEVERWARWSGASWVVVVGRAP